MRLGIRFVRTLGWTLGQTLGLAGMLAACAVTPEPPAVASVPGKPAAPAQIAPAQVDVAFTTDPLTGHVDGPFDPATGRRVAVVIGSDGQMRVRLDPITLKPVLLDEPPAAAVTAPSSVSVPASAPPLPAPLAKAEAKPAAGPAPAKPAVKTEPKPRPRPEPPADAKADAKVEPAATMAGPSSTRPRRLAIEPAKVVFAPVPTSAVGVQLASFFSKEEAAVGWAMSATTNPELVAKAPYLVESRLARTGAAYLRLLATGFESEKEAQDLCAVIKGRGDECFVVRK